MPSSGDGDEGWGHRESGGHFEVILACCSISHRSMRIHSRALHVTVARKSCWLQSRLRNMSVKAMD